MTAPLRVSARHRGEEVASFALPHGADPGRELARLGWAGSLVAAELAGDPERLVLGFEVDPVPIPTDPEPDVPTDADLVLCEGEQLVPFQRAAAYGIVHSSRGVLLTELSATTNSAGRWGLPGGGIDPGEQPVAALHREVFEESGQHVTDPTLLGVWTSHWVGRSPVGRVEDFHAVRIVYAARCPDPTDPVVHDVGGSTSAAGWFSPEEVRALPLGSSWLHLVDALTRPD